MKFAPTCMFSAVVACLLAQSHGVHGALNKKHNEGRQLDGHGAYHHKKHNPYSDPYGRPGRTPPPTERPTPRPSPLPTDRPTPHPTPTPSARPTPKPTPKPSMMPTYRPTRPPPTPRPTQFPTEVVRTSHPTFKPTPYTPPPTTHPSDDPTPAPSPEPSASPTNSAEPSTSAPTVSHEPSNFPTVSEEPSETPTESSEPSETPTQSSEPSESPTVSMEPTEAPLPSITGFVCAVENIDVFGSFCLVLRITGLDIILDNFFEDALEAIRGPLVEFLRANPNASIEAAREFIGDYITEWARADGWAERACQTPGGFSSTFCGRRRLGEEGRKLLSKALLAVDGQERNLQDDDVSEVLAAIFLSFWERNIIVGIIGTVEDYIRAFINFEAAFTVFAPTNAAFEDIGLDFETLRQLLIDLVEEYDFELILTLEEVAQYHLLEGRELPVSALTCSRRYRMFNDLFTRTECGPDGTKYQVGIDLIVGGDDRRRHLQQTEGLPRIIRTLSNNLCSNGIVHAVSHVIGVLPEPTFAPTNTPPPTESVPPGGVLGELVHNIELNGGVPVETVQDVMYNQLSAQLIEPLRRELESTMANPNLGSTIPEDLIPMIPNPNPDFPLDLEVYCDSSPSYNFGYQCQSFFFGALVKVEAAFENYKNLDPAFKKTFTTALREAAGAVNVVEFVVFEETIYTSPPTDSPTPVPPTNSPAPTDPPTSGPTNAPVAAPTRKPTVAPTNVQTSAPTETFAPTTTFSPTTTYYPTYFPTGTFAPTETFAPSLTFEPTDGPTGDGPPTADSICEEVQGDLLSCGCECKQANGSLSDGLDHGYECLANSRFSYKKFCCDTREPPEVGIVVFADGRVCDRKKDWDWKFPDRKLRRKH